MLRRGAKARARHRQKRSGRQNSLVLLCSSLITIYPFLISRLLILVAQLILFREPRKVRVTNRAVSKIVLLRQLCPSLVAFRVPQVGQHSAHEEEVARKA